MPQQPADHHVRKPHAVDAEVCLFPVPPHNPRSASGAAPGHLLPSADSPLQSGSTVAQPPPPSPSPRAGATHTMVRVRVDTLRDLHRIVNAFERLMRACQLHPFLCRGLTACADDKPGPGEESALPSVMTPTTVVLPDDSSVMSKDDPVAGGVTMQLLYDVRAALETALPPSNPSMPGSETSNSQTTPLGALVASPPNNDANVAVLKPSPPRCPNPHHPHHQPAVASEDEDTALLQLLANEGSGSSAVNDNPGRSAADSTDLRSTPSVSRISTHVLVTGEEEETGNKLINQYVVLDDIGSGSSGKVKLAFCLKRNISVAIKVVRRRSSRAGADAPIAAKRRVSLGRRYSNFEESFLREIALMKKLRHPNLVPLYEVIDDPAADKLYLVMKYAEQGAVGSVKKDGTCTHLPLARLVDVALQVGKGLRYLHEHGIVHRDIKPENILSTTEGRVMIADFGVSGLKEGADGAGTPLFMAPELHALSSSSLSEAASADSGHVGHTDMWALGVTLYALLYGQLPFLSVGEVQRAAVKHLSSPPCDDAACREQRSKWVATIGLLLSKAADRRPTAENFLKVTKVLRSALCDACRDAVFTTMPPSIHVVNESASDASCSFTASSELTNAVVGTCPEARGRRTPSHAHDLLLTSEELNAAISEAMHSTPDGHQGLNLDLHPLRMLQSFAQTLSLELDDSTKLDNDRGDCLCSAEMNVSK